MDATAKATAISMFFFIKFIIVCQKKQHIYTLRAPVSKEKSVAEKNFKIKFGIGFMIGLTVSTKISDGPGEC